MSCSWPFSSLQKESRQAAQHGEHVHCLGSIFHAFTKNSFTALTISSLSFWPSPLCRPSTVMIPPSSSSSSRLCHFSIPTALVTHHISLSLSSSHSSGHTHSTLSTTNTQRNNHSSSNTTSTRISLRTSVKPSVNAQKNGSIKSWNAKNGNMSNSASKNVTNKETDSVMGTVFARLVKRLSNSGHENEKAVSSASKKNSKTNQDIASVTLPELECPSRLNQEQSYFCEPIPEKLHRSSHKNKSMHRPQSLVLLRTDSHGSAMATQSSTLSSQDCINPQFPLLSSNFVPEELLEVGIPSSLVPRRSLGSLMLTTAGGKEGDDSSWHFVRPPPDGHSNPVSEGETVVVETDHNVTSTKRDGNLEKLSSQMLEASESKNHTGCIVLAGQRVATNNSAISGGRKKFFAPNLTRAKSELHMNSSLINTADLRRSASVYTLGEWEDPRSSLA